MYPRPDQDRPAPVGRGRTAVVVVAVGVLWTITIVPSLIVLWGVVFIGWALLGITSGEVHLLGAHRRDLDPVAFWLVGGTWFTMGVLWLLFPPG